MPPARRRPSGGNARSRGRIIDRAHRSKGVIATVIAALLWIASCVAIWFITKYQLEHNVYKLLGVVDLMGRDIFWSFDMM